MGQIASLKAEAVVQRVKTKLDWVAGVGAPRISTQLPVEGLSSPARFRVERQSLSAFQQRYQAQLIQLDLDLTHYRDVLLIRSTEPSRAAPTPWTVHGYVHGEYAIEAAIRNRVEEAPMGAVRFVIEAYPLLSSLEEPSLVFHQIEYALDRAVPETIAKIDLRGTREEILKNVGDLDPVVLAAVAFEPGLLPYLPHVKLEVRTFLDDEGHQVLAFFV
jgi:hypothetical protein